MWYMKVMYMWYMRALFYSNMYTFTSSRSSCPIYMKNPRAAIIHKAHVQQLYI